MISPGAVKTRLFRAREAFRAAYNQPDEQTILGSGAKGEQ
jgi:DNA-directed RNA polymerase specialized sigma24 family protein